MNEKLTSPIHQQIVNSIDVMANGASLEQKNLAVRTLCALKRRFLGQDIFSIDSLVFGGFVQTALSTDISSDQMALKQLRDELLGIAPSWNTYAIKHNFVNLLQGDGLQAYRLVKELYHLLSTRRRNLAQEERLTDELYELCYEKITPQTIAELLVTNGCQVLLALPYGFPEEFDLLDNFSSIYPIASPLMLQEHLDYLAGILEKIEGNRTLFIDIHILRSGFNLNLR